ncbi:hypothetical protein SDC9_183998 [bioreactor metagenome]|uniref:Uncharacterized protein n=1 Tax=bioreactor metagenome TaxID=1076179 RepID=A0A645HED3_9ZZZZ
MLSADKKFGITMGDNAEPCIFVLDNGYMAPADTDLKMEPGNWYNILMAVDNNGNFQGALWEKDAPEDAAYFGIALGAFEDGDLYKNKSWELSIGFKGQSTFEIAEYCYYSFEGFVKETAAPVV